MDLNQKQTKLILIIILVAGIVLVSLAPVLGNVLDKTIIAEESEKEIDADSEDDFDKAYTQDISLSEGEKMIIEFSSFYANSTPQLEIITKATSQSGNAPSTVDGNDFLVSTHAFGIDPDNSVASSAEATVPAGGESFYIEFAGTTQAPDQYSPDYLVSVPGDYVVLVTAGDNETKFDITIKTDGPMDAGDIINPVFSTIGWGLIIAFLAVISYQLYQKTTEVKA
ncbi:MAG: hypothetical protein ACOC44_15695 [Promethearchaeia archaeon]